MNKLSVYKNLTVFSLISIALILLYWYATGSPYTDLPLKKRMGVLFFLLTPLSFAIYGIWQDNPHTFKWSTLLCCLYFIHAVMESWANPAATVLALGELTLSLTWFVFSIAWVRIHKNNTI